VIEDDGVGERGKIAYRVGKMYCYQEGKVIHEVNNAEEAEYAVSDSDAERLLQEVKEYVEVLGSQSEFD